MADDSKTPNDKGIAGTKNASGSSHASSNSGKSVESDVGKPKNSAGSKGHNKADDSSAASKVTSGANDSAGKKGNTTASKASGSNKTESDGFPSELEERLEREREERRERRQKRRQKRILTQRLKISSKMKREMFYALENAKLADQPYKAIGYFLFLLIIANAVAVFISVEPGEDNWEYFVTNGFYVFSTVCFMLEYLTRIWIADLAYEDLSPSKARFKYIFSGWGAIDFLSFAPSIVFWFFPAVPWLRNIIAVIRLLRLIKMTRYMRGLRTIGQVLSKRRSEIVASFFAIAFMVFISCIVMYEIEHPAQPEKFNNLLSGLYWAVTTITTTGYGDIVPITPLGRFVGSIIMFLSVALVAIPGGIFSAGFVAEYQHADRPKIKRKQQEENDSVQPNEGEGHSRL